MNTNIPFHKKLVKMDAQRTLTARSAVINQITIVSKPEFTAPQKSSLMLDFRTMLRFASWESWYVAYPVYRPIGG